MNCIAIYTPHNEDIPALPDLTDQHRRVLGIAANADEGRISEYGGYPSLVAFIGPLVVWAYIEGQNEPALIVQPIDDFVRDYWQDPL
jgi:hypothetical protein